MISFKKKARLGVLCLATALMTMSWVQDAAAGYKYVVFGTAGERGVYYPVGGTICRMVKRKIKEHGIRCTVESTGGSIYNLKAIRDKDMEIGFAQSDWQYNATKGTGIFTDQGPDENLRSLFSLHSEAFTIAVSKKSGIKKFDDLKGHRVNIGNPGSGMRATMDDLMKIRGWNKGVFKQATEFTAGEQVNKLCAGVIDAFVFATGHPNGDIQDVTSKCDARLISVPEDVIHQLIKEHPYYTEVVIPKGMYASMPEDVKSFGVKATVVTSKDVDEEVIYQIVKAVFDDFDNFKTTHPILSTLDKQKMISDGLTAPLHEGAIRYYKEAGMLSKE
jgi:TRAP transporter TAXI family solute receptor